MKPLLSDTVVYIQCTSHRYIVLQSYKFQHAYIATQSPLNTTVDDIWRLIYDSGARTIVMLNKIDWDGVRLNINHVYIYIEKENSIH